MPTVDDEIRAYTSLVRIQFAEWKVPQRFWVLILTRRVCFISDPNRSPGRRILRENHTDWWFREEKRWIAGVSPDLICGSFLSRLWEYSWYSKSHLVIYKKDLFVKPPSRRIWLSYFCIDIDALLYYFEFQLGINMI